VPVCGNFARVLSPRRVGISLRRGRQISGKVARHSPTWRDTKGNCAFLRARARGDLCRFLPAKVGHAYRSLFV
jgi:hypothetical protein